MKDITSMYKSRLASLLFLLPLLFGMQEAKAAEIDASPCDAQATAQTKALYRYLRDEVWGKKVLSGCQALWDYNTTEAEKIQGYCGKFPAINVFDFQHYIDSEKGVNWINYHETKARDWQNNGGIVGFMWHWNVPVNVFSEDMGWYGFYAPGGGNSITYMSPAKAMEEGTIEHRIINRELDIIAQYLLEYQSQGVAVLWRPLHEAAGNTNTYNNGKAWFWWGTDGAEAFKKLYRYMYHYFQDKGIHNLIYIWTSQMNDPDWYPGDEYVDIVARDNYSYVNHESGKSEFTKLKSRYPNKMIALAECGVVPAADQMENDGAKWLFVAPWCSDEYVPGKNDESFWQQFMQSSLIITRDQVTVNK